VLAYVLEDADPVHKVTILPTGMALGVTQQLPMEERHIHPRSHIEDALCVRMGGRVAELLVYGDLSTGAANDLVGNTELARRMVREWGMSEDIGPMAWGSQGQVFLGEDLMHTRDYSEHTGQMIDDEVERILRAEEQRAIEVLTRHKLGLDAVAKALLESETVDGATVSRLVDEAFGRPVHATGKKAVTPTFNGHESTNGKSDPVVTAPESPASPVPPAASAQPTPSQPTPSQPTPAQPVPDQAQAPAQPVAEQVQSPAQPVPEEAPVPAVAPAQPVRPTNTTPSGWPAPQWPPPHWSPPPPADPVPGDR